jgi:hypothetical protein
MKAIESLYSSSAAKQRQAFAELSQLQSTGFDSTKVLSLKPKNAATSVAHRLVELAAAPASNSAHALQVIAGLKCDHDAYAPLASAAGLPAVLLQHVAPGPLLVAAVFVTCNLAMTHAHVLRDVHQQLIKKFVELLQTAKDNQTVFALVGVLGAMGMAYMPSVAASKAIDVVLTRKIYIHKYKPIKQVAIGLLASVTDAKGFEQNKTKAMQHDISQCIYKPGGSSGSSGSSSLDTDWLWEEKTPEPLGSLCLLAFHPKVAAALRNVVLPAFLKRDRSYVAPRLRKICQIRVAAEQLVQVVGFGDFLTAWITQRDSADQAWRVSPMCPQQVHSSAATAVQCTAAADGAPSLLPAASCGLPYRLAASVDCVRQSPHAFKPQQQCH